MDTDSADQLSVTTCEPCREQHLRCDRVLPSCSRCVTNGQECVKGYKFKPSRHHPWPRSQKWLGFPKKLKFLLESGVDGSVEETAAETAKASIIVPSPYEDSGRGSRQESHRPSCDNEQYPAKSTYLNDVNKGKQLPDGHPEGAYQGLQEQAAEHNPVRADIYRSVWPLKSRDETILFRHYHQRLAKWLDLCDSNSHFETSIPSRAGNCPILLNAIFALASRHLSHVSPREYDALASNRYHEQCLTYLIPLVDHAITVSDENLFAATIILRVLEEMDVPTLGQDTHGHLLGIHAFVAPLPSSSAPTPLARTPVGAHENHHHQHYQHHNPSAASTRSASPSSQSLASQNRRLQPDSLSAACFWVGLRQEIYSAVMNQQQVRMNLAHPGVVDRSTAPANDYVWANRAIVHCADVLNFCFGEGQRSSDVSRWEELSRANKDWKAALPESYNPIYYRPRGASGDDEGRDTHVRTESEEILAAFPEVWYWKGCHIIAVQHHILAELFLALFNPSHPRTGLARPPAELHLSSFARNSVRHLCGIGVCNQWCPPAMFTACMGIAAAGDRFESREDQDALLEVLRITEKENARPTRAVREQLRHCWKWD